MSTHDKVGRAFYVKTKEFDEDVYEANKKNFQVGIQQNEQGLYQCDSITESTMTVLIAAEGYFTKEVPLVNGQDLYKLSLKPAFIGTLRLKGPNGEAVKGAVIEYYGAPTISDQEGIAKITSPTETATVIFSIKHPDYVFFATSDAIWEFNEKTDSIKEVILAPKTSVTGRVFFNNSAVANAVVFCQRRTSPAIIQTYSTNDGSYFINELMFSGTMSTNKVWAIHPDFGVATASIIALGKNQRVIDLHLKEHKNAKIRLIDQNNTPLASKILALTHNSIEEFSITVITDDKGEVQLKNLLPGFYNIALNDTHIELQKSDKQIDVSSGIRILEAISNRACIKALKPDGSPFDGALRIFQIFPFQKLSLSVDKDEKGIYYTQLEHDKLPFNSYRLIFEAEGYMSIIKEIEDDTEASLLKNGFTIKFQEGENFSLQVINESSNLPIKGATVTITSKYYTTLVSTTNHLGEVKLNNISKEDSIDIKKNGYCGAQLKLNSTQPNMTLRLKQIGGLKGHISFKRKKTWYAIELYHHDKPSHQTEVDAKGSFVFTNVYPGKYTLALKSANEHPHRLSEVLLIESAKVTEVSLNLEQDTMPTGTLNLSLYDKTGNTLKGTNYFLIHKNKDLQYSSDIKTGRASFEKILPGEYLLQLQSLSKTSEYKTLHGGVTILPNVNTLDLYVPGNHLILTVKNEQGEALKKVMVTLYHKDLFGLRFAESNKGQQLTKESGECQYSDLMPKIPYYIVVEEDFSANYVIGVIGPIILEPGKTNHIDYTLPEGRKIPQIQVVDKNNKPISDAGFIIKPTNGFYSQRTTKKEWGLYPYSNKNGFLQENGWPKESLS